MAVHDPPVPATRVESRMNSAAQDLRALRSMSSMSLLGMSVRVQDTPDAAADVTGRVSGTMLEQLEADAFDALLGWTAAAVRKMRRVARILAVLRERAAADMRDVQHLDAGDGPDRARREHHVSHSHAARGSASRELNHGGGGGGGSPYHAASAFTPSPSNTPPLPRRDVAGGSFEGRGRGAGGRSASIDHLLNGMDAFTVVVLQAINHRQRVAAEILRAQAVFEDARLAPKVVTKYGPYAAEVGPDGRIHDMPTAGAVGGREGNGMPTTTTTHNVTVSNIPSHWSPRRVQALGTAFRATQVSVPAIPYGGPPVFVPLAACLNDAADVGAPLRTTTTGHAGGSAGPACDLDPDHRLLYSRVPVYATTAAAAVPCGTGGGGDGACGVLPDEWSATASPRADRAGSPPACDARHPHDVLLGFARREDARACADGLHNTVLDGALALRTARGAPACGVEHAGGGSAHRPPPPLECSPPVHSPATTADPFARAHALPRTPPPLERCVAHRVASARAVVADVMRAARDAPPRADPRDEDEGYEPLY